MLFGDLVSRPSNGSSHGLLRGHRGYEVDLLSQLIIQVKLLLGCRAPDAEPTQKTA